MKLHKLRALAGAVVIFASSVAWADFSGEVVRILDGDTVDVLVNRKPIRVRLANIDAPEKAQAFGSRSRQAIADMVFRRTVVVIEHGQDDTPSKRVLGTIMVDGQNVNAAMVRQGMAWAYRYRGKPSDPGMVPLEAAARQEKIGLWADPHAQEPWQWRRDQRAKK